MSMMQRLISQPVSYELCYQSLSRSSRKWAFECDVDGHVDMDTMPERERNNYLFARATVGIEFDEPQILVCENPQTNKPAR